MRKGLAVLLVMVVMLVPGAGSTEAATLGVPVPYATIQAAVNAAAPSGDVIDIAAGIYVEQVEVNGKDLTLKGAGTALTAIQSPALLPLYFTTGSNKNHPILYLHDAADVRVQDLTVDGLGLGNANYRFIGIGYWNAGGKVTGVDVKHIEDTPLSGAQHGVGVYAYNNGGGPYDLELDDVAVTDFQKTAIALNGPGLTVDVHDCSTTGIGHTAVTAQNGIQLWSADGSVSDCSIADVYYTGASWTASGLLVIGPTTVAVTGSNPISNCQTATYWQDAGGSLDGLSVSGTTDLGVLFYNTSASKPSQRSAEGPAAGTPPREASPLDPGAGKPQFQLRPLSAASLYTASVTNGCLIGPGVADAYGLEVYSAGGGLDVTVEGLEIENWDYGVVNFGPTNLAVNRSVLSGNLSAGLYNGGANTVDARNNWWGDASGPSDLGSGTGDAASGDLIDFSAWLTGGTDLNPGCGFEPPSDTITPQPPSECISIGHDCVTVPVTISRTSTAPMRGFSVQILLSTELGLCSGVASITEGDYLSGGVPGTTTFQVLDLGSGLYTVDCAILGGSPPCGPTASSGTLFSLEVKASGGDGTGTVTPLPLKGRDCDNGPILLDAGLPASITIDTAPPAAVSSLAAAQVKTGNDGDGTTQITLTFTPPGDAAEVEVYRAGFGHYPEYDDDGGAVPATPSYPPGAPWSLTGVTASGQADEVTTRDFWYYVAFCKDACGNVSAVSNKTGGTLNYHLGDVHNGISDCAGNNLVNTADVSFLGAHYGIALVLNDTYNCLDVGPTTNYSVNARPTTDNLVDFEDLILFAINYGQVSKPGVPIGPEPAGVNELTLQVPGLPAPGDLFETAIALSGVGNIQGLSVDLAFDAAVVEPVEVTGGELLARQSRSSTVLSSRPGNVDVALLGAGDGLTGSGELARVAFRVVAPGDPAIALRTVRARDGENRPVSLGLQTGSTGGTKPPVVTWLGPNYPNPFQQTTVIPFGLKVAGRVTLAVFDVQGRRVRGLLDAELPAGDRVLTWDGRDDAGSPLASGFYVLRLQFDGRSYTHAVKLTH